MYTKLGVIIEGKEFPLEEIIKKVTEKRAEDKMLIEIHGEYGRSFDVDERIVIDKEDFYDFCKIMEGKNVYFGEIAGKHSEVSFIIKSHMMFGTSSVSEIVDFLEEHPKGREFNYSFIDKIMDEMCYNEHDEEFERLKSIVDYDYKMSKK